MEQRTKGARKARAKPVVADLTDRRRAEQELAEQRKDLERLVKRRTAELRRANAQLEAEVVSLRRTEELYRTLLDQSLQGVVVVQDQRFVFANTAMERLLGYSRSELAALDREEVRHVVHPDNRAAVWGRHAVRMETGDAEPARYETRLLRKDGTVRWAQVNATLVEYDGRPASQAAIVDITDQRRAEAELQRQLELETLLADVSARFVNIAPGDVDDEVKQALGEAATVLRTERVGLLRVQPDGRSVSMRQDWIAPGFAGAPPDMRDFPSEPLPAGLARALSGEVVELPDAEALGPDLAADRALLARLGLRATLIVPVFSGRNPWGMLALGIWSGNARATGARERTPTASSDSATANWRSSSGSAAG